MKTLLLGAVALAAVTIAGQASAGSIIVTGPGISAALLTATSAAGATSSPFALDSLGQAGTNGLVGTGPYSLGNATVTFSPNASVPHAGEYDGNTPSVAASPYNSTAITPTNYLVAEPNDPATIKFSGYQNYFNLLWGTVDSYNSLSLDFQKDGLDLFRLTVTGSQVAQAVGGGFQANGSTPAFVSLAELPGFDEVILTSTSTAFEFVPGAAVPEPASLALLGTGLAAVGMLRRRRAA